MPGVLDDAAVTVADQSEASRLHNKGRFGRPLSGGALRLTLVEAAYLVEAGRLAVDSAEGPVGLQRLVAAGAERQPGFEIEYLVYRDLRERGFLLAPAAAADRKREVHILGYGRGERPERSAPDLWISAWSEREPLRSDRLLALAQAGAKAGVGNVVALVDEESDLTYYTLTLEEPAGDRPAMVRADAEAVFLKDRVVVWDAEVAQRLHDEAFYGKPVAGSLQLSLVESLFLAKSAGLSVRDGGQGPVLALKDLRARAAAVDPDVEDRLVVYSDLRRRGLTVKTGFKFGTHFRAYDADPRAAHAPFLVHAVRRGTTTGWSQISRAVRLSHSVRKRFLLAVLEGRKVTYLALARHRP